MKMSGFWLTGLILSGIGLLNLVAVTLGILRLPATDVLLVSISFGVLGITCFLADIGLRLQ